MKGPQLTEVLRITDCRMFISTENTSILSAPSPKAEGTMQKRVKNSVRTRRDGRLQRNIFLVEQCNCLNELTVAAMACTNPSQNEFQHGEGS